MDTLLELGLHNAVMATGLALLAAAVGSCCRRPALTHGLWLLVLLKFITPPLFPVPLFWSTQEHPPRENAAAPLPADVKLAQPEAVAALKQPPEGIAEIVLPAQPPAPVDPPALPEVPAPVKEALPPAVAPLPLDAQPGPGETPAVPATPEMGLGWQGMASAVWLCGSLGWFVLALLRIHRFQRLLIHARLAPPALQEQTQQLALRMGLKRPFEVWLVPGSLSPMLWALGPVPLLLLPEKLLERLSDEQRATVLAHELAHLRRRDHWVRRLEMVVLGLYWWLPVVWWARRELHEAEEECCDAWVVSVLPGSARSYATALLETVDFLAGAPAALPPAASGVGHAQFLKRRVTMIFRGNTPRALTAASFLGLVGLGIGLLPLLPTWAQQPRDPSGELGPKGPAGLGDKRGKGGDEQEKIRATIKQIHAELEVRKAELAIHQAALDMALANLKAAQAKLAEIEKDAKRKEQGKIGPENLKGGTGGKGGTTRYPSKGPMSGGKGVGDGSGAFEKRLADLEKKMDTLLREIQNLRRDLARPLVPLPGAPPGVPGGKGGKLPADPSSAPAKNPFGGFGGAPGKAPPGGLGGDVRPGAGGFPGGPTPGGLPPAGGLNPAGEGSTIPGQGTSPAKGLPGGGADSRR
jgi:beta-lactamase regulating signal transducer with metallopeptidase domain